MYLHEDKETFKEIIEQVSDDTGRTAIVIEKDYYVTMILRLLSQKLSNVVFKGGTSLSKGFKAINRFSEDIDITFDEHIGEARRKKLKHVILKVLARNFVCQFLIGMIQRVIKIIMRIYLHINRYGKLRVIECCHQ